MKTFLLLGGFSGFLLALTGSFLADNPLTYVVRDGAIGCIAGAMLFRALHHVYWKAACERFALHAAERKEQLAREAAVQQAD